MRDEAIAGQPSALTKVWRWGIILLSAPLAAYAAQDSAINSKSSLPVQLFPAPLINNLILLEKSASELVTADQPAKFAQQTADASRAVLLSQPLNLPALRLIGFAEDAKTPGSGHKFLYLSDKVSRRDLATQFALIEIAAQSGDVKSTLQHYDRALSVYSEAGEQLYPILANALVEPEIREALAPYGARGWFVAFANKALALKADLSAFSATIALVKSQLNPDQYARINSRILNQLLADERYDEAIALLSEFSPTSRKAMGDVSFTPATSDPKLGLLGWRFTDNETASASLEDSGRLSVTIASNRSSEVAKRMLILPSGTYRIKQTLSYSPTTPPARLTWELRCKRKDNHLIWREVIPAKSATYVAKIQIPENCSAQEWRLQATSSMSQFPSEASITSLNIYHP